LHLKRVEDADASAEDSLLTIEAWHARENCSAGFNPLVDLYAGKHKIMSAG